RCADQKATLLVGLCRQLWCSVAVDEDSNRLPHGGLCRYNDLAKQGTTSTSLWSHLSPVSQRPAVFNRTGSCDWCHGFGSLALHHCRHADDQTGKENSRKSC